MATVNVTNADWVEITGATTTLTNLSSFTAYVCFGDDKATLPGGVGTIGITLPSHASTPVRSGHKIWVMSGSKYTVTIDY